MKFDKNLIVAVPVFFIGYLFATVTNAKDFFNQISSIGSIFAGVGTIALAYLGYKGFDQWKNKFKYEKKFEILCECEIYLQKMIDEYNGFTYKRETEPEGCPKVIGKIYTEQVLNDYSKVITKLNRNFSLCFMQLLPFVPQEDYKEYERQYRWIMFDMFTAIEQKKKKEIDYVGFREKNQALIEQMNTLLSLLREQKVD